MDKRLFVIGGGHFFRERTRKEIMTAVEAEKGKFSTIVCDDPDPDFLSNQINTLSLFDTFKVVRVLNFSVKKGQDQTLRRFFSASEVGCIAIIEEGDTKKYDALIKKLHDLPGALDYLSEHCAEELSKPKDVVDFIMTEGKDIGLDKDGASCLSELCDQDPSLIHCELQKLRLLFDHGPVSRKEILWTVSKSNPGGEQLEIYLAIMYGNTSMAVNCCRTTARELGYDAAFNSIIKLAEAALVISFCKGDGKRAFDFVRQKRVEVPKTKCNRNLWGGENTVEKSAPSQFLYKVAQKIYDRMDEKSIYGLFMRCCDSFVTFRRTANESLASAQLDEFAAVMCR